MRMSIRSVKIESVEDLEALPEGEWVSVPEGMKVDFSYETPELEARVRSMRPRPSLRQRWKAKLAGRFGLRARRARPDAGK